MEGWQKQEGYDLDGIRSLNSSVDAAGLLLGPRSNDPLVLDIDGPLAVKAFQHRYQRHFHSAVPKTFSNAIDRPGSFKLFFKVPPEKWGQLKGKASWKAEGNEDARSDDIELVRESSQAVVAGQQPNKDGDGQGFYSWREGCGPTGVEPTEVPNWLLEPLLKGEESEPPPPGDLTESDYEDLQLAQTIIRDALAPRTSKVTTTG